MLVQRNQLAERFGSEQMGEERSKRPIALNGSRRYEPIGRALRLYLIGRFAEGERLALRENVGEEHVVMAAERVERVVEANEIARDDLRALMDQLVEGML